MEKTATPNTESTVDAPDNLSESDSFSADQKEIADKAGVTLDQPDTETVKAEVKEDKAEPTTQPEIGDASEQSFTKQDPSGLEGELLEKYKSFQKDYTKSKQELAEKMKGFEDSNEAQDNLNQLVEVINSNPDIYALMDRALSGEPSNDTLSDEEKDFNSRVDNLIEEKLSQRLKPHEDRLNREAQEDAIKTKSEFTKKHPDLINEDGTVNEDRWNRLLDIAQYFMPTEDKPGLELDIALKNAHMIINEGNSKEQGKIEALLEVTKNQGAKSHSFTPTGQKPSAVITQLSDDQMYVAKGMGMTSEEYAANLL